MLARNRSQEALKYFELNAADPILARISRRDVLLAKLAVTHTKEIVGRHHVALLAAEYGATLQEAGFRDFSAVTPEQLRLAYLYCEMAEKVYLGKDYYGLEVFALAALAKGRRLCDNLEQDLGGDKRRLDLAGKIERLSEQVRKVVPETWFRVGAHGTFFAEIDRNGLPPKPEEAAGN